MTNFDPQIEKILAKCREMNTPKSNYWIVSDEVGRFLNSQARLIKAKKVLEIGTSIGYSTLFFAEALKHNGADPQKGQKVYTIESHKERFGIATEHILASGLAPYIEQILGHAPEHTPEINPKTKTPFTDIDLLFIDATKKQYLEMMEKAYPLLRPGALIIADNAISHGAAMPDYIETMMNDPRFESKLLDMGTGLLISIKVGTN